MPSARPSDQSRQPNGPGPKSLTQPSHALEQRYKGLPGPTGRAYNGNQKGGPQTIPSTSSSTLPTDSQSNPFENGIPMANVPPFFTTSFISSGKGGGAVRSIGENFEINPANGSCSLTIPIATSTPRAGFGPELALAYDSGHGNGILGFGWSISQPAISRRTAKGIPTYDDDKDVFVLSGGDDLVPVTTASGYHEQTSGGFRVRRYTSRIVEEALRIERWTKLDDPSDFHWKTINGDNVTHIYGQDHDSRIADGANDVPRTYSWLLSYAYDACGNAMCYEYKKEDFDGREGGQPLCWEQNRSDMIWHRQKYLKAIRYGNVKPNRDLDTWEVLPLSSPQKWCFEVVLDYGEHNDKAPSTIEERPWNMRLDPFSSCVAGFEIRSYRLCRRILMFHHFPDELKEADTLVYSCNLAYTETMHGSFLCSYVSCGHTRTSMTSKEQKYATQEMPAMGFKYTQVPTLQNASLLECALSDVHLPSLPNTRSVDWVDIDSEGLPGALLRFKDGTLSYQRNRSVLSDDTSVDFESVRTLSTQPSLRSVRDHYLEDLDGNGKLDFVSVGRTGTISGYYERLDADDWSDFNHFSSVPLQNPSSPDVLRMDLTGNGLQDMLHINENEQIEWQASLGKAGYGPQSTACSQTGSDLPRIFGNERTMVRSVDMTGDGLSDIVSISNGHICYWSNLGFGAFGNRVEMFNPPMIDKHDEFDQSRLHLIDIDGSGTTDLIYLPPGGGANVYFNFYGNSWSDPISVPSFPETDHLTSVFTLDLLGKGTACLCFVTPSSTLLGTPSLKYIDLMGATKPHLLTTWTNGTGLSTSIEYRASTYFYLFDEAQGQPWSTRLPFPVQCVSKIEVSDKIIGSSKITRYRYHDGFYDGVEREFRGFGMVEQIKENILEASICPSPIKDACAVTKSWFHTGTHAFSVRTPFRKTQIFDVMPELLDGDSQGQAYRTLHGKLVRTETHDARAWYSCDTIPYNTVEHSYNVICSQLSSKWATDAAFKVVPSETLTSVYEKSPDPPRISHDLVLKTNVYGDIEQHAKVFYARDGPDKAKRETSLYGQAKTFIEVTISSFTHGIEDDLMCFRKPQLCSVKKFEAKDISSSGIWSKAALQALLDKTTGMSAASELISESRIYYRSTDLKSPLLLGLLEPYSTVDQTFNLVYLPGMLDPFFQQSGETAATTQAECGLVDLESDKRWWAPSPTYEFREFPASSSELATARSSFYIPTTTVDPFEGRTFVEQDKYHLLGRATTDPMGNTITAINDYQRLQPVIITDENRNQQQHALDCFGDVVGTAFSGKVDDKDATESLRDFEAIVATDVVRSFVAQPTEESARALLANANERIIIDREVCDGHGATVVRILRECSDNGEKSKLRIELTYLDGTGRPYQLLEYAGQKDEPWRCSAITSSAPGGDPVVTFMPFFTKTHGLIAPRKVMSPASIGLHDPQGRRVVSIMADGTWAKVERTAWTETHYDAGDTILVEDLSLDPDVGDYCKQFAAGSQSWSKRHKQGGAPEQIAWEKSKMYHNTPTVAIFNSRGLVSAQIEKLQTSELLTRYEHDSGGNVVAEYDCSGRRTVRSAKWDLLGRCYQACGMDNGERWEICDGLRKPVFTCDSRKNVQNVKYDKLRRESEIRSRHGEEPIRVVTEYKYAKSSPETVQANMCGKLWEIKDQSGVTTFQAYDSRGNCLQSMFQPCREYKTVIDWSVGVTLEARELTQRMRYNLLDEVVESCDAFGNRSRRSYDRLGSVVTTDGALVVSADIPREWKPYIVESVYTADGLPSKIRYGNKTSTTFTYDKFSRLLLTQKTTHESGTVLEDRIHVYDCMQRRIRESNSAEQTTFSRNCTIEPINDFTYDPLGRLIAATGRERLQDEGGRETQMRPYSATASSHNISSGNQVCSYIEKYKYDDAGNLTLLRHEPKDDRTMSGWTRRYFYEEQSLLKQKQMSNRLSRTQIGRVEEAYEYRGDAGSRGCITAMPGIRSLAWTFDDRLASATTQLSNDGTPETTYYVYNHSGDRVRKVTERSASSADGLPTRMYDTLYLDDAEVLSRYSATDTLISERHTSHVVGSSRIALVESESLFSQDSLLRFETSENLELDGDGNLVSYEEYSPYGICTYSADTGQVSAPRRYRFARYLRDSETGLDLCGARYYMSWLGRWLSPDPLGTADGLNVYCYTGDNPVNYEDPTGTTRGEKGVKSIRSPENPDYSPQVGKYDDLEKSPLTEERDKLDSEHEAARADLNKVMAKTRDLVANKFSDQVDSATLTPGDFSMKRNDDPTSKSMLNQKFGEDTRKLRDSTTGYNNLFRGNDSGFAPTTVAVGFERHAVEQMKTLEGQMKKFEKNLADSNSLDKLAPLDLKNLRNDEIEFQRQRQAEEKSGIWLRKEVRNTILDNTKKLNSQFKAARQEAKKALKTFEKVGQKLKSVEAKLDKGLKK